MSITIEYLKREDLQAYKCLIDTTFNGSAAIESYETSYDENHPSYKIIVAKDKSKIIGSATIYKIDLFTFAFQPTLEIYNVAVLKEYRGSPAASLLFDFIKDFARENGYQTASVTCLTEAFRAHRFYEKMGFKKLDRFRFQLKI